MSVNFMLPGLYEHFRLNSLFIQYYKKNKEYFYDDINFYAVYGNFQFCIWDGGRVFGDYLQTTKEEIKEITKFYNEEHGLPMRFVFTNNQLKEEHYYDRFCNLILSLCENPINEIVLVDDKLKQYIKENYPQYSYISSTTKCLLNKEKIIEELNNDEFKMVCLDYNLNKNFELLDNLTEQQKSKTEFLINAICPPGCVNRKNHYRLNSLCHLNYGKAYNISCPIQNSTLHPNACNSRNNLTPEEIYNIYSPKGFQYYKLEGRTLSYSEVLLNYIRYMVKPEYQFFVANEIYLQLL